MLSFNKKFKHNEIRVNPVLIRPVTGDQVYTSDKKYMDKLFDLSGYKSTNTVNDLETLAEFIVTDIVFPDQYSVYADESKAKFILITDNTYDCCNEIFKMMDNNPDIHYYRCKTSGDTVMEDCYYVKTPKGAELLLVISLLRESVRVYQYCKGVIQDYATIDMSNQDEADYLKDIINTTEIDEASFMSTYPTDLSITFGEMDDILLSLKILKRSKGKLSLRIDEDSPMYSMIDFVGYITTRSMMTPIESRFTMIEGYTTGDLFKFVDEVLHGQIDSSVNPTSLLWLFDEISNSRLSSFSKSKVPFTYKSICDTLVSES